MDTCEIPRWQQLKQSLHNLNFDDFVKAVELNENAVLLDVRTSEEFQQGRIKGAKNLDYLSSSLADDLEVLDPSLHYYVYCRTSRRSLRVCILLRNMGFKHITNLDEGIKDHFNRLVIE